MQNVTLGEKIKQLERTLKQELDENADKIHTIVSMEKQTNMISNALDTSVEKQKSLKGAIQSLSRESIDQTRRIKQLETQLKDEMETAAESNYEQNEKITNLDNQVESTLKENADKIMMIVKLEKSEKFLCGALDASLEKQMAYKKDLEIETKKSVARSKQVKEQNEKVKQLEKQLLDEQEEKAMKNEQIANLENNDMLLTRQIEEAQTKQKSMKKTL